MPIFICLRKIYGVGPEEAKEHLQLWGLSSLTPVKLVDPAFFAFVLWRKHKFPKFGAGKLFCFSFFFR